MPVVKFLLKESVNLDKIDSTGVSPLYLAILRGHEDIAKLLYFKGASVHAPTEKLAKLLCICGFKGDLSKIRLLKECEADIEIADYDLRTVAHLAAAEGHWPCVDYLARHTSFNFALKDRWGKTPLDEVADPTKRSEIQELLQIGRKGGSSAKMVEEADSDEEVEQKVGKMLKSPAK